MSISFGIFKNSDIKELQQMENQSNKPDQNANEGGDDEFTEQKRLGIALDDLTEMKMLMMKREFDNELLVTRIKLLEEELHYMKNEVSDPPTKQNTEDYKLNYNTKENYVEYLHEKLKFIQEQEHGNTYAEKQMEFERLKQENIGLEEQNKRLKKIYLNLKNKNENLEEDASKFYQIIEPAKKMRKIFDIYYVTGKLNQERVVELELDKRHPILSDLVKEIKEEGAEEEEQSTDVYQNFDKNKLAAMLREADKKIEQQGAQIEKMMKAQTDQKIENMKLMDQLKEQFNKEKEQLKITYETQITTIQKTLTIKMKKQKEELDKTIQEKEQKMTEASKRQVGGDQGQAELYKNQLNQAQKQLEVQKATNKKVQQQLDDLKQEILDQQNEQLRKEEMKKKQEASQKLRGESEKNQQVTELEQKVEDLQTEKKKLLQKLQIAENQLKDLNSKNLKNQEEIEKMEMNVSQLSQYKTIVEQQKDPSGVDLKEMVKKQAEAEQLQKKFQALTKEVEIVKEEKEQLGGKLERTEKELQEAKREISDKAKEVSNLQQELVKIQGDGQINEHKQEIHQSQLMQKDQTLNELNKNFTDKMKRFEKFFKKHQIPINDLSPSEVEAELDLLNDKIDKNEKDLKQNQIQMDFYRKEANRTNEIYASALLMQSQLQTDNPELLKKELENRKTDIKHLRQEAQLKNKLIADQKNELEKLRNRVGELEKQKTDNLQKIAQLDGVKEQLQQSKSIMRQNSRISNLGGDQEALVKLKSQLGIEEKEKNFFKEQYEQASKDLKKNEEERNELAVKVQELTVKQIYEKMTYDGQSVRVKELEEQKKELRLKLEQTILDNEKLQDQYKRLQKALDEEDFNNPEKTVKFQALLKENNDLKDNISQLNTQLMVKDKKIDKVQKDINEIKEEAKENEDLKLRLRKTREILRSRDVEILELIKDANRKKDVFEKMAAMLEQTKFKEQLHSLDIGVREAKIEILQNGNEQVQQGIERELEPFRQKYTIQKTGLQETKALYQKLDELNKQLFDYQNTEKFKEVKNSPFYIEAQMKIQELENSLKLKQEQIVNSKYKIESNTDHITRQNQDKKSMEQKIDNTQHQIQQLEGKLGELRSSKAMLEITVKELKTDKQIFKDENASLERKLLNEIQKNTEYKVVLNDLENKIKRLQERLDNSQADIFNKNKQIEYQKKENERLEDEIIKSAEIFINKTAEANSKSGNASDSRVEELENRVSAQRRQIKDLEEQYEKQRTQNEQQSQLLKKQIQELQNQVEFFKKSENMTQSQLLNLEREHALMKQVNDQDKMIIDLKEQVILLKNQNQNQGLNNKNHDLNESVFSMENVKKVTQVFGTNLRQEEKGDDHEHCQERMKSQRKQIEQLETHNNLLQNQINRYFDMLKDNKYEQESDKNSLKEFYTNQFANLDNPKKESKILDLQKKISNQKNQVLELQKDNYYLKDKIKSLENQYEQKQLEFQKIYEENHKIKQNVQLKDLEKDKGKTESNKILQMLEEKDKYYKNLIKMNEQEILQLKEQKAQLDQIKADNNDLQKQIEKLKSLLKKEKEMASFAKSTVDELQEKYDKLQKAHKSTQAANQQLVTENESLNVQLDSQVEAVNDVKKQIKTLEMQVQDLQQTLNMRNKTIFDLNQKISKLDKEMQTQIADENMKIKFREKDREISDLKKKIEINQDLEIEMNGLKRQILENKEKQEAKDKEIVELKKRVNENQVEILDLKNKVESSKHSIKSKEEKLTQQEKDLLSQKQVLKDLEGEKALLQNEIEKNIEEMRVMEKEQVQQEREFEQEYGELKELMTNKLSEMKLFKSKAEQKIQELEKENQILVLTNEGLYRKIATIEAQKI